MDHKGISHTHHHDQATASAETQHRVAAPTTAVQEREDVLAGDRRAFMRMLGNAFMGVTAVATAACSNDEPEMGSDTSNTLGDGSSKLPGGICPDQPPAVKHALELAKTSCTDCHTHGGSGAGAWETPDPTSGAKGVNDAMNKLFPHAAKTAPNGGAYMIEFAQQHVKNDAGQLHLGGARKLTDEDQKILNDLHEAAATIDISKGPAPSLAVNVSCEADQYKMSREAFLSGVKMRSLSETYTDARRRWTELPALESEQNFNTQDELRNALRDLTHSTGFYNMLVSGLNDMTFTNFYANDDDAIKFMGDRYGVPWANYSNKRLAQGPGNLLAYIMHQERPIKELLTAPYFVLPGDKNHDQPENPNNPDWVAQLQAFMPQGIPLAGLPSDPLWLGQFPTTKTNKGRHRAWEIMRRFFNTDVLDIASRNVDAPKDITFPTIQTAVCVACHAANTDGMGGGGLDDFAAATFDFQSDKSGTRYVHATKLPPEMLSISLYKQSIPLDDPNKLGKMMQLVTADPDGSGYPFAVSMAKIGYTMLTGRDPSKEPRLDETDYEPKMRRYQAEKDFFAEMALVLKTKNYNFRELLVEMMMSPWCTANGEITEALTPDRKIELASIGPRMITPEILAARMRQLFGNDLITSGIDKLIRKDFNLDLGGIDSDTVRVRRRDANSASELVRISLGFWSDKLVQSDLAKGPSQRSLFNDLDFGTGSLLQAPFKPGTNTPIGDNEKKYRAALVKIHAHAFGEYLTPDSPEITNAMNRWSEIWMEILKDLDGGKIASIHRSQGSDGADALGLYRAWGVYVASIVSSMKFNS